MNTSKATSIIRLAKKDAVSAALFPLRLLPVKNDQVMIINEVSLKFAGSPKCVAEHLAAQEPGRYEIYYAVGDPARYQYLREQGIIPVKYMSPEYFLRSMTAKVFLSNAGGYSFLPLRSSQYVINTWHGGGIYKKGGLDVLGRDPLSVADVKKTGKKTSCMLSSCKRFTEAFNRAYLIPREKFWEIGLPRNDAMRRPNPEKVSQTRRQWGLAEDEKLVLFAPTFRQRNDMSCGEEVAVDYGLNVDRLLGAIQKRFGGRWRFAYRLHPKIRNRASDCFGDALNLSDYEDMQDVLAVADVLVNDFSSSMWDFMLTGKPCFLFAKDLQHYIETVDVYTPVEEWPFPKATNNDELEKNILEFDEEKYAADCKRHYEALGGCETGAATKLVCERIHEVCFGK